MTEFERRVRAAITALRKGEVATYGEVAEEAGHPGAARAVGNVLAGSEGLLGVVGIFEFDVLHIDESLST